MMTLGRIQRPTPVNNYYIEITAFGYIRNNWYEAETAEKALEKAKRSVGLKIRVVREKEENDV